MIISPRFGRCLFATLALALCIATPVFADDVQDINQMLKQGQLSQALDRADSALAKKPRDAQIRFLKGLILTEQKKTTEAITVFLKLSEDYPELPEPYNNLAVLYASQGQYDKARAALEMAIRTHPAYATAHENLGDIYAKLASQAYDKALQLDSSNTAAQTKLSLIRNIASNTPNAARASSATAKLAAAKPEISAALSAPPPMPAAAPAPKEIKPVIAPEAKVPEPKTVEKKSPEPTKTSTAEAEITKTLQAWAKAWAQKDVPAYLAHYAKDFQTPGGQARSEWEQVRRQRISHAKSIAVSLDAIRVQPLSDGAVKATFRQNYRSDALKTGSTKTLVMVKVGSNWLIQQERIGK